MNGNTVELVGNVTRDPELRFTPSGQAVATFGLAITRRWQNRQTNAWEEASSFFDIVAWGQLGENVAESVTRGARVIVVGRLEQRSWTDKSGAKRSKVEVIADDIGPSLKWATTVVTRNERVGGEQHAGSAAQPAAGGTYDYDEEPFFCTLDEWDPLHNFGAIPERRLGGSEP